MTAARLTVPARVRPPGTSDNFKIQSSLKYHRLSQAAEPWNRKQATLVYLQGEKESTFSLS